MGNLLNEQLSAFGVAQVVVILKRPTRPAAAKPSAALAAAIPVAASRKALVTAQSDVMQLGKYFRISETSTDSALALTARRRRKKSAGLHWYGRAKSSASPTPPVRYFPNLGVMLGTTDRKGLKMLRAHAKVKDVVSPPILSLIRPVSTAAATPKKQSTWGILRLKADQLQQQGLTGQGIIVGHLDTGADGTHPALKSAFQAFAEFDMMGFQVTPSPAAHDTDEHGTHTAGTIAGRDVGGVAIGMAPGALLASAIVIEGGNATARVLAGMDWIIGQGAKILSMSLGFRGYLEDFLPLTQILRERGVLPVFAIGNEGPGTSRSPGNYDISLSVGAMDPKGKVANFSGSQEFSRQVESTVPCLVAPGVGVISAMPGGGYQEMDGSSMATPHIAGLAALLMEAKPQASIDQIEKAIFDSCALLPGELPERQGRGVPDGVQALALLP
jgi:subtilisin family serine protease